MVDAPSYDYDSDQLARDYEAVSAGRQFLAGKQLVAEVAPAPGAHVLDLGCGTGLLSEHIADVVGPTGFVLGLDPLPLRIDLAKKKARANLALEVGDAYALDALATGAFDAVVLNAVFHWLPDKTGPMKSFARILKTGGRLGLSTTLKGRRTIVQEEAARVLAEPPFGQYPRKRETLSHRVSLEEMRALLEEAGFDATKIDVVHSEQRFASPAEAIRFAEASSFGNFLGHLPPDLRAPAREKLADRLAAVAGADEIVQPRERLVVVGTRR
jgi:ubiquinone/menaquinone biosynthesis C-methylase UbiE